MGRTGLAVVVGMMAATIAVGIGRALPGEVRAKPVVDESRLVVLWTSGDADVAHRVCFMYTHNAARNKWVNEVRLVVWGPSQRILVGDKDLQAEVKAMMADGIKVEACISCAKSYGVVDALRKLGLEVKGMGPVLSEYLKTGWKVLTF